MINTGLKDKLYTYFRTTLNMRDYRNNWLKGDCPYCGKKDKFGINLSLNRSNCFVCGGKLRPLYLIMELEEIATKGETLKFLQHYEGLEYFERKFISLIDPNKNVILPEGFKSLSTANSEMGKMFRNYVTKRGFDPDEMALKGWGYCNSGKYKGYLIIPVYYKGKLVYFTSRRILGNGPKFLNLSTDEAPVGKGGILYNHEALFIYDKIRIVESIMNAETLGDNTIAIGGSHFSDFQYSQILKSPATHFTILLDHDAWINAIYMALSLAPVKQVKPIYFKDDRDVNELGKLKTLKLIFKNRYISYNECLKLKNNYEESILTYN